MSAIQLTNCPRCGHQKWKYLGDDLAEEPPCGLCTSMGSSFTCIEGRHSDCGGRTVTDTCACWCHVRRSAEATASPAKEKP